MGSSFWRLVDLLTLDSGPGNRCQGVVAIGGTKVKEGERQRVGANV